MLVTLGGNGTAAAPLLYFGWMAYLTVALRRWMGGRWWPQLLRAWTLITVHGICLSPVLSLTMVLTLPRACAFTLPMARNCARSASGGWRMSKPPSP